MYSNRILERFASPKFAGALRGCNGSGKAEDEKGGDVIKLYMLIDDNSIISNCKFKAFGGVSTIVACDIACQMLIGKTLEEGLSISNLDILEEMGEIPQDREYVALLVEEAIKNAIEDYYKRKEREAKKAIN